MRALVQVNGELQRHGRVRVRRTREGAREVTAPIDLATDADIAEALRLHAAATPGPWITGDHVGEPRALCAAATPDESLLGLDRDGMAIVLGSSLAQGKNDAAFIAAARLLLPKMAAHLAAFKAAGAGMTTPWNSAAEEGDETARLVAAFATLRALCGDGPTDLVPVIA
jgi:hypothetical protein